MLVRELLPLVTGVDRIVELAPEGSDVIRELQAPDDLPRHRLSPGDTPAEPLQPGDLVVAAVGPDRTEPDDLAPALGALPPGGRLLLFSSWPVAELPYHRLLDPLGAASLQVTDAVPLSQSRRGHHVALLATRVTEPVPPRGYLLGLGGEPATGEHDKLATMLRMANEHVLGELVARPARRRLREQDIELAELRAELAELRIERDTLRHRLTTAEQQNERLMASASFRVGRTVVDSARHPARAVVSAPRDLVQIWRARHADTGRGAAKPAAAEPPHRTITVKVPGRPDRQLRLTVPTDLLPPKLGRSWPTAGEAVADFLATLDVAAPGAVFDLDAGIGLHAGLAGALTDRPVVAFQPAPGPAGAARRFALDNGLGFRTESLMVGDHTGTAEVAGLRVPAETLDAYVNRTGLAPAVLRLNAAAVGRVLAGGTDTVKVHRPWIVVDGDGAAAREALAPHGYHRYEGSAVFAPEAQDDRFGAARQERRDQLSGPGTPR